jgi:PAS domain S-box-containing protein
MSVSESGLLGLHDPRLKPLAVSPMPAWLWSTDATQVIWTNAAGAAAFDVPAEALGEGRLEPRPQAMAEVARLAATLAVDGEPRIEYLQGFADGAEARAFTCSRITLADGSDAILIAAIAPAGRAALQRRYPLRFVWQIGPDDGFTIGSDEFIALAGPQTAAVLGRPWHEIAAALGLDPEGRIAGSLASHDTWSGLTVAWPADDTAERLTVELSGLPVFDRDRRFRGYRGFGVCRDLPRLSALAQARRGEMISAPALAEDDGAGEDAGTENIMPFPPAAADGMPPALTPVERHAFRELSRRLTDRLGKAGLPDAREDAPEGERHGVAVGSAEPGSAGEQDPRLAQAQAEVRELKAILDTATDGVLVLARGGRILSANRSAQALFGYEAHELLRLPFAAVLAPESERAAADYLAGLLRDGVATVMNDGREVIGRERQGGLIPLFMTVGHVGDDPEKLCAVFRDLTQWKKTEEELIAAKRQAEKASSAKSDFLAKVSHEIRTPLNAILGFSEVMMEERFGAIGNDRYRQYLKDIHASGGHLIALINDLLDLSKIEAGKLELAFASVSLNDLTQQSVALMQPQANRERIVIRTSLSPKLPQVSADARSVRQIVLNLISNSIKFSGPGGQVIVSTALTDGGEVVLRVRDTGIGMSESEIVIALEPFRQVATSMRFGSGGTGLGLPLTKALVEANGAGFHINSKPNAGTLVEVTFPSARVLAE